MINGYLEHTVVTEKETTLHVILALDYVDLKSTSSFQDVL